MPLSRALLLKGLGGLTAASAAAVGAYGAMHPKKFADFFKSQNQINEEQKKKAKEVNENLKTLGLSEDDCKLETSDFTTSSDYSKECSLDKDKFQKIKFFDGEQSATINGWTEEKNIKLKISSKSNGGIEFLLSGHPSNLTITKSGEQTEKVTIKKEIETEFKEERGRLVKVINQAYKTKLEGVNEKLKTLGLTDETCKFDVTERDKVLECGLDGDKLKALKFSNKQDDQNLTLTGDVGNDLKIKVEVGEGNDPSFSFTGLSQDLTLYGDKTKGKIILRQSGEGRFRVVGDRLTKESPKEVLKNLNQSLGSLNIPVGCRFDEAENEDSIECNVSETEIKTIGFSNKGEGELTVKDWPSGSGTKIKLKVEKDKDNAMSLSFPDITSGTEIKLFGDKSRGKIILKSTPETKFKVVDGKLTKGTPNADLKKFNEQLGKVNAPVECRFDEAESDTSVECTITEDEFKALNFSNKPTTGDLKVVGWNGNTNVKLKAEKGTQNEMSISFTGLTSDIKVFGDKNKGKIIVKNSAGGNKKFKVIDDKLTKENPDVELKKFNEELGTVNAPIECRFDESETFATATAECTVSKDDLKKMVFSKDQGDQTYTAGENFSGMKLSLKTNKELDGRGTDVKSVFLTFKDYSETVKLSKNSQEVVSLIKGTNPEFGIGEDEEEEDESDVLVLKKLWDDNEVATKLTLNECKITAGQNRGECTFDETLKSVNLAKSNNANDFNSLTITNPANDKFEFHKDQEGYNQGYKFVFKGETVKDSRNSICLESDGEYEFKWKIQNSNARTAYLVKKGS